MTREEANKRVDQLLDKNNDIVLELATGFGKTYIAASRASGKRTLVVIPTIPI